MNSPRGWIRDIAEIPTVNEHSLEIGAQFAADPGGNDQRLVLIGGHAIDITRISELIAAITEAADTLRSA